VNSSQVWPSKTTASLIHSANIRPSTDTAMRAFFSATCTGHRDRQFGNPRTSLRLCGPLAASYEPTKPEGAAMRVLERQSEQGTRLARHHEVARETGRGRPETGDVARRAGGTGARTGGTGRPCHYDVRGAVLLGKLNPSLLKPPNEWQQLPRVPFQPRFPVPTRSTRERRGAGSPEEHGCCHSKHS
jgi:hypothetical protein